MEAGTPDKWEEKQKEISIIADAQRLLQDAKERDYAPDVIKAIQEAVKAIANCDASRYDNNADYSDDQVKEMPADAQKKLMKKRGIILEVDAE